MSRECPRLECDGCGTIRTGQPATTHDDLRQVLVEVGWKSDKARDIDFCSRCLAHSDGTA